MLVLLTEFYNFMDRHIEINCKLLLLLVTSKSVVLGEVFLFLDDVNVGGGSAAGDGSDEGAVLGANVVQVRLGRLGAVFGGFELALEAADAAQVLLGHSLLFR